MAKTPEHPGPEEMEGTVRVPLKTAEELGLTHDELEEQQRLAEEVIGEIIEEEGKKPEENPINVEAEPTLLEDDFDPRLLDSGLYRAYSNTPAYPLLWGMITTGNAVLGGYRYHEGGVVEMLAGVDVVGEAEANPQDVEKFQAAVVVPHEAFTSIPEEEYGDTTWQQMWWREVIQNAIDAGASEIDCNVSEQDDGTWLVSCQDNGHGMDVDGILSLFFTLKATKKFGETTIGGFGEAKKFIALAWINFRVRSQDAEVVGSGATWPNLDASRGHPQMKGTLVEVVMPADKHTTAQAAEDFIVKCYLPGVKFTVNGTPVKAALRAKKFKKDLPYETKLYEDKKGTINGALVRANGLYMFTEDLPSDYQGTVFIEMTPKREGYPTPKDLFSATRMDFRYGNEVSKAVREFLQLARSDVREALRNQEDLVRKEYEGAGLFSNTREQAAAVRDIAGALPETPKGGSLMMTAEKQGAVVEVVKSIHVKASERVGGDESRTIGLIDPEIAAILFAHVAFKGESHLEAAVKQLVWKPDFLIMNDDTMRRRFRIDKRFEPETMTGSVLALAKCWAELVRLIFFASGTKAQWGTGFVFSKEAMGMYQEQPSGRKFICLNPISFETGKLYSIRNDEHLSKVFGIAIHECAHFVLGANDNYHGPSWAKAMSRLTETLLRYWPEAKRIASKIKIRGAVPPARQRRKQRANQLDMMGEWMEDREDHEILMVYPLREEDEKKYSQEYLIPEDHLELFLYGEEAVRFVELAERVDASAAYRLLEAGTEAPTEFRVGREHVDNLVHDTFSPVDGSYKAPPDEAMPVRVRLRADGLLQMRPADRKMTRFITHPDDFDIPMSASIVIFAEGGYRGEGVEKLINAILREKLGVEPGTVESGDIKETLAGGEAITILYDSYRYKELLRNHLQAIRLHLYFGDDADAVVPGDLMPRVGTIAVPVELDYNDDIVFDFHYTNDYQVWKWYTWVYDLPKDRGIRFRIRDEWEKKKFLGMLPKPTVEVLESQGHINLTMNIDFFERLLEYHLDDARQARKKLDRHVAAELLGIEAEGNVYTTIMGLGRNRDEVLVVVPALSHSRLSRLHDDFPESWDWPIRFFVYPGEEDYRWFEGDTAVMRSLHDKGVANKDLTFLNVWTKLGQMFGSEETLRPGDYIPVTLQYHKGDEAETEFVRVAPADPRHVRYMEKHFGLARSKTVIAQHGHNKARALMEQVVMTTTIDPATAREMEESFWRGHSRVLGILDWDDYSMELQEQGVAVPSRTAP